MAGLIGAVWGITGLSLLLGSALFRLCPYAIELLDMSFEWKHGLALMASLVFMGYAEGYRGFHCRFSPRAAARARYLKDQPTYLRVVLAPLFCMGFFHSTRKRKVVAYGVTAMVVLLIVLVRQLSQPWRGIVDAGVVLGIGWGLCSFWLFTFRAFFDKNFAVSPEIPEQ